MQSSCYSDLNATSKKHSSGSNARSNLCDLVDDRHSVVYNARSWGAACTLKHGTSLFTSLGSEKVNSVVVGQELFFTVVAASKGMSETKSRH